jgi:hypothetical protein
MQKRTTFGRALAELERKQERSKQPTTRPETLVPSAIRTAPEVFQRRIIVGGDVDDYHVRELTRALRTKNGGALDPIVVTQIGKDAYCVDGHHRLAAYKAAKVTDPVPVEWFEGSVLEAYREAVRRNVKDKLPMSRDAKLEAAWREVVLGQLSKAAIVEMTGVANGTVGTMRSKLRELKEAYLAKADEFAVADSSDNANDEFLCDLTWREAKAHGKGYAECDAEWKEVIVNQWAERLAKAFGAEWGKQPELAAAAIARYSERMPEKLIEVWKEDGLIDEVDADEDL